MTSEPVTSEPAAGDTVVSDPVVRGTRVSDTAVRGTAVRGTAVSAPSVSDTVPSDTVPSDPVPSDTAEPRPPAGRRDAVRNYHRILEAARDVLGESGADASMEEIAARAGVGVGTVYRRFANKDALIDELVRMSMCEALGTARQALASPGGGGLEYLLRGFGQLFAGHARYAHLLLQRSADGAATQEMRAAVEELTARALAAGTVNPDVTLGDVMALIWAMRGLTETTGEVAPETWQRFLDIHLAGLRAPGRLSGSPALSAGEVSRLLPPSGGGQG